MNLFKSDPASLSIESNKYANKKILKLTNKSKVRPVIRQNIIKYKGLSLSVPNDHEEYLEYYYGKSWKRKVEFWSDKPRR